MAAADSAIGWLEELPERTGIETEVIRFLLATDLATLGMEDSARSQLRSLMRSSPSLAPAAFTALARLWSEAEENEALFQAARFAPWDGMTDEDLAETAYRVARACFRTGRYPEAREWAQQVARSSDFFPFARYLLAQSEYALGRYGAAVAAAEAIFSSREPAEAIASLQDRTAVLLGDMFIEIGLYDHAQAVLAWPAPASAWHTRAQRDALLARGLAALDESRFEDAERLSTLAATALDRLADEIGEAVESDARLTAVAAQLRQAWPPRQTILRRRLWAAQRAGDAMERARGFGFGRLLTVMWRSFPPVILYHFARHQPQPEVPRPVLDDPTRFFLSPRPEVARALAALALLEENSGDAGCRGRAGAVLRRRMAESLAGSAPAPTLAEIDPLVRGCGESGGTSATTDEAQRRLREAITADARQLRLEVRRSRYALEEAIARARLEHRAAVQAAGGSR